MIKYNAEQLASIDKMTWFLDPKQKEHYEMVLIGPAGTGKTTILKEVIKKYDNKTTMGGTISHAAKKVLFDNCGEYMQCYTIAQLFKMKREISDKETFQVDVSSWGDNPPPILHANILIIDECSMIDSKIKQLIVKHTPKGCKIIYVGDPYQLPPVEGSGKDSPTFDLPIRAELVQPMRFDSIIGDIALHYRGLIHQINIQNPVYQEQIVFDYFNENHDSMAYLSKDNYKFKELALKYFTSDERDNTRILSYRNHTINETNKYIRSFLYEEYPPYHVGEQVIMNRPHGNRINNGDILRIKNIREEIDKIWVYIHNGMKFNKECVRIPVYKMLVTQNGYEMGELNVVRPEGFHIYESYRERMAMQATNIDRKLWKDYFNFRDTFSDISYVYCMSTHKSQGQSIDNVFVIAYDILETAKTDLKTKLQSLYVSVTRPKKTLNVLFR